MAPGHVPGALVGCHALDRAEGTVEARGRLRWHDIALEQCSDQLEGMPAMPGPGSADRSPGQQPDQGARAGRKRAQRAVTDRRPIPWPSGRPTRWGDRPRPRADLQPPAGESGSRGVVSGSPALRDHRAGRVIRAGNNGASPVNPLACGDGRARQRRRCRPAGQRLRGQPSPPPVAGAAFSRMRPFPWSPIPSMASTHAVDHASPRQARSRSSRHPIVVSRRLKGISYQTSASACDSRG